LPPAVGNLGGFVGPYLMGWMQGVSGDFRIGVRVLAAIAICSGIIVLTISSQGSNLRAVRVEP
jgi:ACS family tartrate transporter-like MFS transporter